LIKSALHYRARTCAHENLSVHYFAFRCSNKQNQQILPLTRTAREGERGKKKKKKRKKEEKRKKKEKRKRKKGKKGKKFSRDRPLCSRIEHRLWRVFANAGLLIVSAVSALSRELHASRARRTIESAANRKRRRRDFYSRRGATERATARKSCITLDFPNATSSRGIYRPLVDRSDSSFAPLARAPALANRSACRSGPSAATRTFDQREPCGTETKTWLVLARNFIPAFPAGQARSVYSYAMNYCRANRYANSPALGEIFRRRLQAARFAVL